MSQTIAQCIQVSSKLDFPMTFRLQIHVSGAVQGVGFRPFVYHLALSEHLNGSVANSPEGVVIDVEGTKPHLTSFLERLETEKPPLSFYYAVESRWVEPRGAKVFEIVPSSNEGAYEPILLPDVAICSDCRQDIHDPTNRRYHYPFTNCTNCGPRYTIVESLPYDRPRTVMKQFTMCQDCRKEYESPEDRRFHAQPISCPHCGPKLFLYESSGALVCEGRDANVVDDILSQASDCLAHGGIVVLLGLGGAQLLVDARNESAVQRLRENKHRDAKPFAVMVGNMNEVEKLAMIKEEERRVLQSPASPIVLVEPSAYGCEQIAPAVCMGSPWLGVMLPTTPLHELLLEKWGGIAVVTSGNLSDEPLCITPDECLEKLGPLSDLMILHDRPILRPVDDSVIRVLHGKEIMLRRARGYAPLPVCIESASNDHQDVLALGGQMKNAPGWLMRGRFVLSQHLGDLDTAAAMDSFERTIADMGDLIHAEPQILAVDAHPDYCATQFGYHWAGKHSLNIIPVQHHVAHAMACVVENQVKLPALGVAWDGTGYGSDGTIWGGEWFDLQESSYSRVASIRPFFLPGGDLAVKNPVRSAWSLCQSVKNDYPEEDWSFIEEKVTRKLNETERKTVAIMMARHINSPQTSSMGRFFDAMAFFLGFDQPIRCEGQAAMQLEWWGWQFPREQWTQESVLRWERTMRDDGVSIWSWVPVLRGLQEGWKRGLSRATLAWKFHAGLAEMILDEARLSGHDKICVGGGCFQNALLLELLLSRAENANITVYHPQRVPAHDGGLALGQLGAVLHHYSLDQ